MNGVTRQEFETLKHRVAHLEIRATQQEEKLDAAIANINAEIEKGFSDWAEKAESQEKLVREIHERLFDDPNTLSRIKNQGAL